MKRTLFRSLLMVTVVAMVVFNIACTKKNPTNPTPVDVTYNVTSPFDIVTELTPAVQVNGTISTDTGSYSVTHLGNTTCQYTSDNTDAVYSSSTNGSVTVNASESGVKIPLVTPAILSPLAAMTGGTNSPFQGKMRFYIPEDTVGVDDAARLRAFISPDYYSSICEETTEQSGNNVVIAHFNQDHDANSANVETGQRTSGHIYFRDGTGEDFFGEEILQLYTGVGNVSGYQLPFPCLLNGTAGSGPYKTDVITEGDKATVDLLVNHLKSTARIEASGITNK